MGKRCMIGMFGLAFILVILSGIVLLIMRKNEKEEAVSLSKEKIVVSPPRIMGWVAIIGMLFFTAVILTMCFSPNGTEAPWLFFAFFLFDLLGGYLLWITLVWQIEVFRDEDFFILRDYWGHKHKIFYTDCTSYQYRYHQQEIIIRNHIKNFTISYLLVNYGILVAALQQHNVERGKDL